jgi:hypothetical protein
MESLRMLPSVILGFRQTNEGFLGGDSVDASLVAIHQYTYYATPRPFHTLIFIASNPMPRAFWPDKPEALGYSLPRDSGQWRRTGFVNWGPGIVGHGFHEGGIHMLVFYAVLFGIAFRFFDELLARQPDNPYLLATFAAVSGQLMAFARGDIGLFSVLILSGFFTVLALNYLVRIFTGVGLSYPRRDRPQPVVVLDDGTVYDPGAQPPHSTYDPSTN